MADIIQKIRDDITVESVLMTVIKMPGVKIKRDVFLRKELYKYCSEEEIQLAIKYNPAKAGISKELINKISKSVITYETNKVSAISVAASLPSSAAPVAAVGAASADIYSYFAHIIRVAQELAYLYGFEQFNLKDDEIDSDTMTSLMYFIGTMLGVQEAAIQLNKLANTIANHVAKNLAKKALTKGTVYPIVKQIATKIGIRMTKQIFADTVASAIPIAGSVLSGGLTYAMFRPSCMNLRKKLMSYNLCDPDYYRVVADVQAEET